MKNFVQEVRTEDEYTKLQSKASTGNLSENNLEQFNIY